jgi:hypothetical protein
MGYGLMDLNADQGDCVMRRYFRYRAQRFAAVGLFAFLACLFWGVFAPTDVVCQNSIADEIISLNVTAKPLGEVLKNISTATGCQFSINSSWEDYPITTSFQNKPLHKALKIILRNLNNAVIYGSERTVKIIIYNESASSEKAASQSVVIGPSAESMSSVSPAQEATAPQPEVPMPPDSSPPDAEQSPDDNTESVSEQNEADAGNQEAQEKVEEQIRDSESEPQPGATGQDERQTAEDEPAAENPENAEENQETNQN